MNARSLTCCLITLIALPLAVRAAELQVPSGFVAELVAGPPLVRHPMMAGYDDRGRLFVAESAGLNLNNKELDAQTPNYISLLEDTNGDGIFDKSTVFADKMTFPQGALWYRGALYVCSPPGLWKLEDTDDDGKADKRTLLVGGFEYTGNAADVHGPFLGPTGRLYWCHGRKGHEVYNKDGTLVSKGKGARIWSCLPDGSDVQVFAGGGMDNPVELVFTEAGDMLGTVNLFYGRPRGDVLVHWQYGGVYPRDDVGPVLDEFVRTGDLLPEVYNFGHIAISGFNRYRSGAFGKEYKENLFVTQFNTGKVKRMVLERSGSTYKATEHDFLSSADHDFHPTDVLEDADGSLLVIDTGGWFRIGCPTSQIAKPDVRGGIYRIRKVDQPKVADARGQKIDWAKQTPEQLVKLLDDARFEVRDKAVDELALRGEKAVGALKKATVTSSITQNINAVWALARMNNESAKLAVRDVLQNSQQAEVLSAAIRAIVETNDRQALPLIANLVEKTSGSTQREAVAVLGRFKYDTALPVLTTMLKTRMDRQMEHALLYALIQIGKPEALLALINQKQGEQSQRALTVLEQTKGYNLDSKVVMQCFDEGDDTLVHTATQIASRHPEWAPAFAAKLDEWMAIPRISERQVEPLFTLTPLYLKNEVMALSFGKFLSKDDHAESVQMIAKAGGVKLHPSWKEPLAKRLASAKPEMVENALAAVTTVGAMEFKPELESLAANEAMPVPVRLKALSLSAPKGTVVNDKVFTLLSGQLQSSKPAPVRSEAAKLLAGAALTTEQLLSLAKLLPQCGPVELPTLVNAFAKSKEVIVGQALVPGLRAANGLNNVKLADLSKVLRAYPEPVLGEANKLLADLETQAKEQAGRLAELEKTITGGDASRGQEVFYSAKAVCSTCHTVQRRGGQVGPDLSQIGRIRTERDLLEAILYPSASLARDFESYTVATKDGESVAGVIQRETPEVIQLANASGTPLLIPRNTVVSVTPSALSIMPQGLDQALTKEELRDLVAFLRSLK